MKKFLINSFKTALFVFATSLLFGWAMSFLYARAHIFKTTMVNNFDEEPTHIILGSSRALTTLDTKMIQEARKEKGEVWYNLSMDDSSPEIHLLLIKMLLERGIIPQKIYLQFDRTKSPKNLYEWQDNDYRFVPMLSKSPAVSDYFRNKKNYYYVKYLPLGTYAYFNTELIYPALIIAKNKNYTHRFDAFGDVSYPNNKKVKWDGESKNVSLNFEDNTLLEINALCKKNNIDLVLFIAPYLDRKVINANAEVLDYSSELTDTQYFYDVQHVNKAGKNKLTEIFITSLK